jgi:hypothetical protein
MSDDERPRAWATFGEPVSPGPRTALYLHALDRWEAQRAAQEAREREERRERHEEYLERFLMHEWHVAVLEGRPGIDFGNPSSFVTSVESRISRAEDMQDAEARAVERKVMLDAGLVHLLEPTHAADTASRSAGDAGGAVVGGPAAPPAVGRARVRARARAALARMTHKATRSGCRCAACEPGQLTREVARELGPMITRSTEDYRR